MGRIEFHKNTALPLTMSTQTDILRLSPSEQSAICLCVERKGSGGKVDLTSVAICLVCISLPNLTAGIGSRYGS